MACVSSEALETLTATPPVPRLAQSQSSGSKARSAIRRWSQRLVVVCAFVYPAALLSSCLAFYWLGEDWWVTAAGLYAPRIAFGIPLPFIVLALWLARRWRFWWTQLVSVFVLTVPLMGFSFPLPTAARSGEHSLRVLSFNVNSAYGGWRAVADKIFAETPDLVLLQECPWDQDLAEALRERFPHVQSSTQFIIASRYPITKTVDPERLPFFGRARSPRFMHYVVASPAGDIAVYSIHPISPRGVLHLHQFRAALHELRTGALFAGDPETDMRTNSALRSQQIAAVALAAEQESLPVLIAGDTNLPGLSAVLRKNLRSYTDGFRAASWGFGYTFPASHPFLRLDRILASEKLGFTSFHVACGGVSDHLCVVADIQALK